MSTLPPVREWRVHIGAHKTATTHIQYRLEALRAPLAAADLDVLLPESGVRELKLHRITEKPSKLWYLRPRRTARLTDKLEPLRSGPRGIILSEEQMMGRLKTALYEPLYWQLPYMASLIGALGKSAPVHLFLSTRSLDTFLPSAYAQLVRHRAPPPAGFDEVRRTFARHPMRWSDVVATLCRHAPQARLTVWRYENYRANADRVLSAICGLDTLPPIPEIAPPVRTKSGSGAAVVAVAALPRSLSPRDRRRRAAQIYADPAHDGAPFDPLTAAEKEELRGRYEEDWDRIRRDHPEAVLDLGG